MTDNLFRLAYCSRTAIPGLAEATEAELSRILATSRMNNMRCGVTGAMLHNHGYFAQVLEGPLEGVQQTFERIQCDPRHSDVVVLQAERTSKRLFSGWDMALAEIGNPAAANAVLMPAMSDRSAGPGNAVVTMLSDLVCREAEWGMAGAATRAA